MKHILIRGFRWLLFLTPIFLLNVQSASANSGESSTSGKQASFGFELDVGYPQVLGKMGQSFTNQVGFGAKIFLPGLLGPDIELFGMAGYQSFTPVGLTSGSFRLVPLIAGVSIAGQTPITGLYTTVGGGIGGTLGWIAVSGQSANSFRVSSYFSTYIEPGLSYEIGPGMFLRLSMPVNYLITTRQMGYLTWAGGFKMLF